MIEPSRYIRKAVTGALTLQSVEAYDQAPPSSATPPYCTVSVSYEPYSTKCAGMYRTTTTITFYSQYREDGGSKSLDELADIALGIMVPDSHTYLSIENFNHANCKLLGSDERINRDNSTTEFIKVMRFESLVQEQ
jgi:hypothetical protein